MLCSDQTQFSKAHHHQCLIASRSVTTVGNPRDRTVQHRARVTRRATQCSNFGSTSCRTNVGRVVDRTTKHRTQVTQHTDNDDKHHMRHQPLLV